MRLSLLEDHEGKGTLSTQWKCEARNTWASGAVVLPKAPGFERRALLYELHHHLNHYQIFGSGYRAGAIALLEQLTAERSF